MGAVEEGRRDADEGGDQVISGLFATGPREAVGGQLVSTLAQRTLVPGTNRSDDHPLVSSTAHAAFWAALGCVGPSQVDRLKVERERTRPTQRLDGWEKVGSI